MQEIADWLGRLGLVQYAQRFAENEIDVSVLPHLTDQDLKDIHIPLGHRRKILAAISEPAAAAQAAPEVSAASIAPKTPDVAERRQVTVMFADLVGSTELSARMDPEDLRDVISTYQKCVTETVRRFDGFVAKYMGDGVLAYFGYPQAHEDDAERAVRAGLDLIARLAAAQGARCSASPCRYSHRSCGGGRSGRFWRGAGARHCRRDPEPCCSLTKYRRAQHGGFSRRHAQACRKPVRAAGSWDT